MKHGWQFFVFACAWALVGRLALEANPHPTSGDALLIGGAWLVGFLFLTGYLIDGFRGAKELLGNTAMGFIFVSGAAALVILLLTLFQWATAMNGS